MLKLSRSPKDRGFPENTKSSSPSIRRKQFKRNSPGLKAGNGYLSKKILLTPKMIFLYNTASKPEKVYPVT